MDKKQSTGDVQSTTTSELKIISATISQMPGGFFDPIPGVHVKTEDDKVHFLFEYYPDEISFKTDEFIGLTLEEARSLKFKKDKAYLTS